MMSGGCRAFLLAMKKSSELPLLLVKFRIQEFQKQGNDGLPGGFAVRASDDHIRKCMAALFRIGVIDPQQVIHAAGKRFLGFHFR